MTRKRILPSLWRRLGRGVLLGLMVFGQGRLTFHHHVGVAEVVSSTQVSSKRASGTAEATCPTCALAAHSSYTSVSVPALLPAPSRSETVAVSAQPAVAASSLIRLAARAPPAC